MSDAEFLEAVHIVRAVVRRRLNVPPRLLEDAQGAAIVSLAEFRRLYTPGPVPFKRAGIAMALNRARNFVRRECREPLQGEDGILADAPQSPPGSPQFAGDWQRLLGLLDRLPERQRRALELRYGFSGQSPQKWRVIAAQTGCNNRNRVQILVQQARRNLAFLAAHPHIETAAQLRHARCQANGAKAARSRRVPVWSDEEITRALRLRRQGLTYDAVGRLLGRPGNAVRVRLSRIHPGDQS